MSKIDEAVHFTLALETDSDTNMEEIHDLALRLINELQDSEAESAEFVSDTRQFLSNAKGDPLTIGTLALAVSVAAIPNTILLIQNWMLRQQDDKLKVRIGEVEVEIPRDATRAEIDRVIDIVKSIPNNKGPEANLR